MLIRDDRGLGGWKPGRFPLMAAERMPTFTSRSHKPHAHYNPDRVLIDCPDCKRSHFVTVDECPDAAEAAAETAMADSLK